MSLESPWQASWNWSWSRLGLQGGVWQAALKPPWQASWTCSWSGCGPLEVQEISYMGGWVLEMKLEWVWALRSPGVADGGEFQGQVAKLVWSLCTLCRLWLGGWSAWIVLRPGWSRGGGRATNGSLQCQRLSLQSTPIWQMISGVNRFPFIPSSCPLNHGFFTVLQGGQVSSPALWWLLSTSLLTYTL